MNKLILIGFISLFSIFANADEQKSLFEKAQPFLGTAEFVFEGVNNDKTTCAPSLRSTYWMNEGFIDIQLLDEENGVNFVDENPRTRDYLENSFVFDIVNSENISPDETFITKTSITPLKVSEFTFKKKKFSKKYKAINGVSLSLSNEHLILRTYKKDKLLKVCYYLKK